MGFNIKFLNYWVVNSNHSFFPFTNYKMVNFLSF